MNNAIKRTRMRAGGRGSNNYIVPAAKFIGNPVHAYIGISGADLYRGDPDHPKISRNDGTTILPYWGTGANQEYDPGR